MPVRPPQANAKHISITHTITTSGNHLMISSWRPVKRPHWNSFVASHGEMVHLHLISPGGAGGRPGFGGASGKIAGKPSHCVDIVLGSSAPEKWGCGLGSWDERRARPVPLAPEESSAACGSSLLSNLNLNMAPFAFLVQN